MTGKDKASNTAGPAPAANGKRKAHNHEQSDKPSFISCTHCRSRKIKCTGERPTCSNCQKKGFKCQYDAVVRRRGPDKEPGGRLKPRGTFVNLYAHSQPGSAPRLSKATVEGAPQRTGASGTEAPSKTVTKTESTRRGTKGKSRTQSSSQPPQVINDWWQTLFDGMSEEELLKQCKIFLEDVDLWFNFFHRGLFFKLFFSRQLGPHVIFAILAHTTLLHDGTTKTGQLRAISYAEEARKILDYYLSTTTPEPTLVQTALLLVAFEFQPHIHQNLARATAALGYVETCAKICLPCWMQTAELPTARHNPSTVPKDSSNATQPLSSSKITQSSTQAVRTEELRRMCWTLSQLAANSTIWRHLAEQPSLDLASADPTRFMLLFPLDITSSKADQQVPNKISSWVLYHKAVCLWHVALNEVLHGPRREHIVKQARAVISETDASEGKSGSRNYVWQARQWAVAARGHLGDLDRHEIVSWFETQKAVLEQFSGNDNQSRSRKPTFCWWYLMVAFTALRLSTEADEFASHTESVLSFVYEALESIVSMWPCSSLEHHYQALKRRHASVLRHREPGISNETRV